MTNTGTETVGNILSRLGYVFDKENIVEDIDEDRISYTYRGANISFSVIECDEHDGRRYQGRYYHDDNVWGIENPQAYIQTDFETTDQRWDNKDLDFIKRNRNMSSPDLFRNFVKIELSEMKKIRDALCSDGFEAHLYEIVDVGEEGIPYPMTIE